jgi:hypothetical protein
MKKLAIFAEGQTEQLLSEKAVIYSAKEKQYAITKCSARGGSKHNPRIIEIGAESNNTEYFILIIDCGTDSRVKSDILERYPTLMQAGYEKIIGIRDVYPSVQYNELSRLRFGLNQGLPNGILPISFILGVMEIEAWILAEHTHFQKFNSNLTIERIRTELGIDLKNEHVSQRANPSKDLANIYWLEKIEYDKSNKIVSQILKVLDQQELRNTVSDNFEDLLQLYRELESFFSN